MPLGICLGDVTGIGPEVTLKALAAEYARDETRHVIFGDSVLLNELNTKLGLRLPLVGGRIEIRNPWGQELRPDLPKGDPAAAHAAMAWLKEAAAACLRGEIAGMVTAPVSKEAIVRAGYDFVGQTELLSGLAGTQRTAMMLLGHDDRGRWLRVTLATTHVPIRHLAEKITKEAVLLAIDLAAQACRDLRLPRTRIAVCGLNPHAGESGKIGNEEIVAIAPAVEAARSNGIDAIGPMSADALFYYAYRGDFDAVVAMYHDQGLGPLKMVCFEHGVNWTLGLPFIRTSPDHGTAYDIAGKGVADPSSMVAALRLAKQLANAFLE
jgi:4-hydroxythreonine-4-phosphate dehydrogenase